MERAYPDSTAITRLVERLCAELSRQFGIENDFLSFSFDGKLGDDVQSLSKHYKIDISKQLQKMLEVEEALQNKTTKIKMILHHPSLVCQYYGFNYYKCARLKKKIKELDDAHYDAIITVSFPFYTHIAGAAAKATQHIIYQFDPFSQFEKYTYLRKSLYELIERKTLRKAKKIFLIEPMLNSNRKNSLKIYLPKMEEIFCCGIWEKKRTGTFAFADTASVLLLFCGYIQKEIRNPDFLLKTASCLPDDFKLCILGGSQEKLSFDSNKIYIQEAVKTDKADDAMLQADILVNIGNNSRDQVPSKLYDYISTGKPIVSFVKFRDSCENQLLEKYPNALLIYEKEVSPQKAADEILNFIKKVQNKALPFEMVHKLYRKATPEYAAQQIYNAVEK